MQSDRPGQRLAARHSRCRAGNVIKVQHLLDHVAGLPADAPTFPDGGLWTAYAPGEHWHYSNTGYDILGKLAEHLGGKPLDRLLEERIFAPLGMRRTRGAIIAADRLLYAQGYEAADPTSRSRAAPRWPRPPGSTGHVWRGSVASTADDMNRFLRIARQRRAGPRRPWPVPAAGPGFHVALRRQRHAGDVLRQRPDARRQRRPVLPPPYRRDGQLLILLPPRCGERRRRLRLRHGQRLPRISPAAAHQLRGRCADQRRVGPAAARAAVARSCHCPTRPPMSAAIRDPPAPSQVRARRAADPGRRGRRARRAATVGRRFVPHHACAFQALCAEVRANRRRGHRRQLGPEHLRPRGIAARPSQCPTRRSPGSPAAMSTTARGSGREGRRARRAAVAGHRNAAGPDRRQPVAHRPGKLVARAGVLRGFHRRTPADSSSSQARNS